MGILRPARATERKSQQQPLALLELRDFLANSAQIPSERLPPLLKILEDNWVVDVETLRKSMHALEKHLPAAAHMQLSRALAASPVKAPDRYAVETGSAADTATEVAAAPPGGLSSAVKFDTIGGGFAEHGPKHATPASVRQATAPPGASEASLAGAAAFLAGEAQPSAYATAAEERAARAADFRAEVERRRRQLGTSARLALSPTGNVARVWDEGVLTTAVAFCLVLMPFELGSAP